MKTMFVAQENSTKKRFQKPNILRKRSKPSTKIEATSIQGSTSVKTLVATTIASTPNQHSDNICKPKSSQMLILDSDMLSENSNLGDLYQIDINVDSESILDETHHLTIDNQESALETTINVESFLNTNEVEQIVSQADVVHELNERRKQEWCLDFINNAQEIIIEDIDGSHLGSLRLANAPNIVNAVPLSAVISQDQSIEPTVPPPVPTQNLTLQYLDSSTVNFKCDIANCKKWFRSQQSLDKHKVTHKKGAKGNKTVVIECPVKKIKNDGCEEQCSFCCHSKEAMVQHLNEAHSPEDAMYMCEECGRRFYWASGLRAHARTHLTTGRAPLVCAWPGCGRAFRQPCRLREHMRAHTGDKPYPCRYPGCGWSFRTASKLVRHTRRHTGERRHLCARCHRAFRRADHLRDHRRRCCPAHLCSLPGCQKKFSNFETLKLHMQKIHKQEPPIPTKKEPLEEPSSPILLAEHKTEESFLINLNSPALNADSLPEVPDISPPLDSNGYELNEMKIMSPTSIIEGISKEDDMEESRSIMETRAARTHCTWPFTRPLTPNSFADEDNAPYVMEDVQVAESSESNTYTIRSDLFLHGNVLHNEDSEQMASVETNSLLVVPHTEDSNLGLLDAHPTIDLMQEELLYTDAAVDESSFRVFLLSGEELV